MRTKSISVAHRFLAASLTLVANMAASAYAYTQAHGGTPPSGYVQVGNGPVVGPKQ